MINASQTSSSAANRPEGAGTGGVTGQGPADRVKQDPSSFQHSFRLALIPLSVSLRREGGTLKQNGKLGTPLVISPGGQESEKTCAGTE